MNITNTVMIVCNNTQSKRKLADILADEYKVIDIESADEAIDILSEKNNGVDVIISGCLGGTEQIRELMSALREHKNLKKLPIVGVLRMEDESSHYDVLDYGVADVIYSPFKPDLVKLRIKNVISASRTSYMEKIKRLSEYDSITGIYNKNKFFSETRVMLDNNPDVDFAFIRFDINRFSLINSFYGTKVGDGVLRRIGKGLSEFSKTQDLFTFGRIDADIFGLCMRFNGKEALEKGIKDGAPTTLVNGDYSVIIAVGIYIIGDKDISIDAMYDRATLASKKIKGNYINTFEYYNDDMRLALEAEQQIINEMNYALKTGQFEPYYQPKYDLVTNKPVGAEALARWIHPERGLISPAEFIPVFERNGFISKLDFYIWECVCKHIADWKKRGLPLFPISVNVSRVNLYNPNIVNVITNLTKKYDIEPKYLNLELTESLYTEMNTIIDRTTMELQSKGYIIMMDDFGSGYSSLNVLKDVPVDVLKMDMRFMSKAKKEGRAENILASVVRMAKWLNMPVIAEGVDSKEQVDFLRGVGCEYIQGYYFAKPMPVKEYEELISKQEVFQERETSGFNGNGLWSSSSAKSAIESSLLPTGIFEYGNNGTVDVVSVNKSFYEEFGYESVMIHNLNVLDLLVPKDKKVVTDAINETIRTGHICECVCRRITANRKRRWIRIKLKYYGKTDISHIIIASLYDITDEKELDDQLAFYSKSVFREQNRRKNILVISDNREDIAQLEDILSGNYGLDIVEDCQKGFEMLQIKQIDLVVLSIKNIFTEGKKFIDEVRSCEGDDRITIIAATDDISAEGQERIYAIGVDDFTVKPFVELTLVSRVKNLLKLNSGYADMVGTI